MGYVREIAKKSIWVLILLFILYVLQHFINFLSYDYRGPSAALVKVLTNLGLEGDLARFILYELFQLAAALLFCTLLFRKSLHELGFNLRNRNAARKYILVYFNVYPLLLAVCWVILGTWLGRMALTGGVTQGTLGYAVKDILAFGLFPGIGEEPLFRIFVIRFLLLTVFKGTDIGGKKTLAAVVLLSALIFSYGHIFILSWSPFTATYDPVQLLTAFVLGIFFAVTYIRTKSILTAVVCHSYSDLIYRLGNYVVFYGLVN